MPGPSPQSCAACRQAKRKCSGHYPACTRCIQQDRRCVYPSQTPTSLAGATQRDSDSTAVSPPSSATNLSGLADRVGDLEPCQAYFLDADFFHRNSTLKLSQRVYQLPPDLYAEVQDRLLSLPYNPDAYFETIHGFFPIGKASWT
jgi:Fungal Zn(2)-Cys(6) binuclear cluster domain